MDLARAFLSIQRTDLAEQYLRQAIQVDPSSREDIEQDAVLRELLRE